MGLMCLLAANLLHCRNSLCLHLRSRDSYNNEGFRGKGSITNSFLFSPHKNYTERKLKRKSGNTKIPITFLCFLQPPNSAGDISFTGEYAIDIPLIPLTTKQKQKKNISWLNQRHSFGAYSTRQIKEYLKDRHFRNSIIWT